MSGREDVFYRPHILIKRQKTEILVFRRKKFRERELTDARSAPALLTDVC
jgi:hypothetical protein